MSNGRQPTIKLDEAAGIAPASLRLTELPRNAPWQFCVQLFASVRTCCGCERLVVMVIAVVCVCVCAVPCRWRAHVAAHPHEHRSHLIPRRGIRPDCSLHRNIGRELIRSSPRNKSRFDLSFAVTSGFTFVRLPNLSLALCAIERAKIVNFTKTLPGQQKNPKNVIKTSTNISFDLLHFFAACVIICASAHLFCTVRRW